MIERKITRCFTQTEVARQVKKKHKNQTGLDVEAQYWDIRFEDKTYVICEKVPYYGTNIVGPDQTPRIMRGVLSRPTIVVAHKHFFAPCAV